MTVRIATDSESRTVFGFFEEVAPGSTKELFDDSDVWIVDQDDGGRVAAIATMDLASLPNDVIATGDHVGLRIGSLEGNDFHLDLQGAVLLASVSRELSVRVNEQAARMWSYGKDILGDSVLWWPKSLRPGDACIVVNARWEAIGIGRIIGRGKGQTRPVVSPVHDIGTYLRDQSASGPPERGGG